MRLALALLAALVAAGCVSPVSTSPASNDALSLRGEFVDPIHDDHDHSDLGAHELWTPSMERIGYSSLGGDGATFTSFGEIDVHGSLGVVAAQLIDTPRRGAVVMVDLSDPSAPTRLGYATVAEQNHPLDVKFDEKGEFVYAVATGQILAFDVRDPSSPKPAGAMLPRGSACHMSALGVVEDVEYFFCTGDPVGLTVYRVVAAGDGRALVPVGQFFPDGAPNQGEGARALGAPHDMTFQLDPVDGTPILVVSNRGFGVRILDVSDPMMPREVAKWHGEGAEFFSNHLHTAMVTVIDDTRYLIVTPEILTTGYPPAVWVLDATDYGSLELVAEWWAPGAHPSPGFTFTTHQWQVTDGRLYMGYYHAGVWVLDVRAMLVEGFMDDPFRPDVLGYYLPHEAPVEDGLMVPNVWDVNLKDGLMFVTCINSGLYVLHFTADEMGDPAISGFA